VICISRAFGAGGEEVGRRVAEETGFAYVDEEIVQRAAEKAGVSVDLVADAEQRKRLGSRLFREITASLAGSSMYVGIQSPTEAAESSADYRDLIQQAIHETAERGDVVIVAHAASFTLVDKPNVLRVLVTGSPELRVRRLVEEGTEEPEARKLVWQGDAARVSYLKRFHGVREELPTHYDLVLNTDRLSVDDAAGIVLSAAGRASS
jgi:cytidylate kinase